MKKYLSATEAAAKLGLSRARIKLLCAQERIKGACKAGNVWIIPLPVRVLPPAK